MEFDHSIRLSAQASAFEALERDFQARRVGFGTPYELGFGVDIR